MPLTKLSLREQCRNRRAAIDAVQAETAAQAVASHMRSYLSDSMPSIIAGYAAIRQELDPRPALEAAARLGHRLCLPVMVQDDAPLVFRGWQSGEELHRGKHGICVPPESNPVLIPDIVMVPLLAFDRAGRRLGYGGGYYDRTLAVLRGSEKPIAIIGLAYSMQRMDALPEESHDERLDAVITESGIEYFT